MRILSLHIKNIRGIKNITISPNGQNVVVYGPNGTGKSAIVDAIDFLLTGKISRLTGEGSKVLELSEHGCHVDSRTDLKNTIVTAKVKIGDEEITLSRSIAKPSRLNVEPRKNKEKILKILAIAELGQHILTRRDILQYITAEAGKRAKKVMSLLDLDNIESLRQTLVALKNEAENEDANNEVNLEVAKKNISTLLGIDGFLEEQVLTKVNEIRQSLNGAAIAALSIDQIKKDLEPHPFKMGKSFNIEELNSTLKETIKFLGDLATIRSEESELRSLVKEVQGDRMLRKYVLYKTLFKAGISLTEENNICPLCGQVWKGDLSKYLIEKEKETEIGREKQERITVISHSLIERVAVFKNFLTTYIKAIDEYEMKDIDPAAAVALLDELSSWQEVLSDPLTSYEENQWPPLTLEQALGKGLLEKQVLGPFEEHLVSVKPESTTQQTAWDNLTKLEERWRLYEQVLSQKRVSSAYKNRTTQAVDKFEIARNSTLENIYDNVQSDFEKYYKTMHGTDEQNFSLDISYEGAEMKFEVDFYQRGKFPPQALHSEGHQDSMGIALFFALNSYLVKNAIEVIVLDDVVMSIDSSHRRGVCELLELFSSSRQFIITTHDSAWGKQLRAQGIVGADNLIHFANWNIETGPIYELEKDLWASLEEDLNKDQIAIAAARLRRNAECFFENTCDCLQAELKYHGFQQWDLGEFASASVGAYRKYLKKAKSNANALNDKERLAELSALEKTAEAVFARTQIDQWVLNENVHYNKWSSFSKEDFSPLISAYRNLFALFYCSKCGYPITYVELRGENARTSVNCKCGAFFWNVT
jgi:recombinational DNA repair ATPase RecF